MNPIEWEQNVASKYEGRTRPPRYRCRQRIITRHMGMHDFNLVLTNEPGQFASTRNIQDPNPNQTKPQTLYQVNL